MVISFSAMIRLRVPNLASDMPAKNLGKVDKQFSVWCDINLLSVISSAMTVTSRVLASKKNIPFEYRWK